MLSWAPIPNAETMCEAVHEVVYKSCVWVGYEKGAEALYINGGVGVFYVTGGVGWVPVW